MHRKKIGSVALNASALCVLTFWISERIFLSETLLGFHMARYSLSDRGGRKNLNKMLPVAADFPFQGWVWSDRREQVTSLQLLQRLGRAGCWLRASPMSLPMSHGFSAQDPSSHRILLEESCSPRETGSDKEMTHHPCS